MKPKVLIIGKSVAGLIAATRLATQGCQVTVLSGPSGPNSLDHLSPVTSADLPLFVRGFEHQTLSILEELGQTRNILKFPALEFLTSQNHSAKFFRFPISSSFCTVLALVFFKGLSFKTRFTLINYLEKLWEGENRFPLDLDTHRASDWLISLNQPPQAISSIWNPLCRFLLGTDLVHTSAGVFAKTLHRCFLLSSRSSGLFCLSPGLRERLFTSLWHQLPRIGVTVTDHDSAYSFQSDGSVITGISIQEGGVLTADWYIAAGSPRQLTSLLSDRLLAKYSYFHYLQELDEAPILTVQFRTNLCTHQPRLILKSGHFHCVTLTNDSSNHSSPVTHVTCLSAGNADLLHYEDKDLFDVAQQELQDIFPRHIFSSDSQPIRLSASRMAFSFLPLTPGISKYRPPTQSPFSNLVLAGDWTDTGLPTGIESALISGHRCASLIEERISSTALSH